ncbi:hypothetical protein CANCADRAFT_141971 [Tortispora caseinolytica NRRL Y-17796]|uniref:Uncharacterized protein n=1 Tax=Tortispora caseinolytica NRRL Y-17796 TaxID=767744 RepID=A0A1E4TD47_9ASCO|nr:hypothetical protein CANCADRAFT_141971 [Tortispora caseinolytica NRRL Y-17796]
MSKYVSMGRGGAGNVRSADEEIQVEEGSAGQDIPVLEQKVFTTGRGGRGNMMHNDDPKLSRMAQDIDENKEEVLEAHTGDKPTFYESGMSVGRGGYGNIRQTEEAERSLFEKAKELFKKH